MNGGGGAGGEGVANSLSPSKKINCLFLLLVFGSAVVILPIHRRPYPVFLLFIGTLLPPF